MSSHSENLGLFLGQCLSTEEVEAPSFRFVDFFIVFDFYIILLGLLGFFRIGGEIGGWKILYKNGLLQGRLE